MIQTEDLRMQVGDILAGDGATLDVQTGKVLTLLDQKCAGKTTSVRMLKSVLSPRRARERLARCDVTRLPDKVWASVGMLTEQHGLKLRLTGVK